MSSFPCRLGSILILATSLVHLAAAPPTADQRAEALLSALKRGDYAAAYETFGPRMRDALPPSKLQEVWTGQTASLGKLVSWTVSAGAPIRGQDLRVATLKMERGSLAATIAVDPATGDVSGFFIKPVASKDNVPPPPKRAPYADPSRYQERPVTVAVDSFPLSGTLTLPSELGPFPAAVLVHGSGPHDRDETIGPNHVFKDLAEGLSSRGIAVLRYDKRTLQHRDKLAGVKSISMDEEVVDDAVAAIQVLKTTPGVDTSRVFVIGHSLGALLAPEIGVRSRAAGVVLLAPPGRLPWEIILSQMRTLGAPANEVVDVERKAALLKSGKLGDETLLGVPAAYWMDWAARDGVAMAKRFDRPILILRGGRDYQVEDVDIATWRTGLSGHPKVEIVTLPGLNHLFMTGSGKPGPAEYMIPGHVEASVIERLAAFTARPAAR